MFHLPVKVSFPIQFSNMGTFTQQNLRGVFDSSDFENEGAIKKMASAIIFTAQN